MSFIPRSTLWPGRNTFDSPCHLAGRAGESTNLSCGRAKASVLPDHCNCHGFWNGMSSLLWPICNTTDAFQVYCAVLVLLTQILSMRRSLQKDQTLTATHDNSVAWTGIGSASLLLWDRRTVAASIREVMSPALYLGGILVLHITIPALFSMESFTSSCSVTVLTRGLPSFNLSGLDFFTETHRDPYW